MLQSKHKWQLNLIAIFFVTNSSVVRFISEKNLLKRMGNNMKKYSGTNFSINIFSDCLRKFLGSKNIAEGTQSPDKDYDTVNGSITVGANSEVGDLSTVNGSVNVSPGTKVGSAETVNGSINSLQMV